MEFSTSYLIYFSGFITYRLYMYDTNTCLFPSLHQHKQTYLISFSGIQTSFSLKINALLNCQNLIEINRATSQKQTCLNAQRCLSEQSIVYICSEGETPLNVNHTFNTGTVTSVYVVTKFLCSLTLYLTSTTVARMSARFSQIFNPSYQLENQ